MKRKVLLAALAGAAMLTVSAKNDPTLMTIDGKKVTLSEFQYLYNKNNSQQAQQQSIDDYVDMFVVYKLKVADAEAAGIDTTTAFINEFNGYRNELARPYLRDTTVYNTLVQEAYDHMKEEVMVSHIMLYRGENPDLDKQYELKLDSIRTAILNGADFVENVMKHSIDGSKQYNQGNQGYVIAGRFPYEFEKAAFDTKVGEISPVFSTEFGHHIVKVHERRPAKGEVMVQHILLLTQGLDSVAAANQKLAIDSLYAELKNGADFDSIAKIHSQDPGSGRNGGRLPWFGAGRMVPEFEKVSFELQNGEISEPFATSYGYHIVKKLDSKGIPSFEESQELITNMMARDGRINQPEYAMLMTLREKYNSRINQEVYDMLMAEINTHGQLDTTIIDKLSGNEKTLLFVGDRKISLGEVISTFNVPAAIKASGAEAYVKTRSNEYLNNATLDMAREDMMEDNPDYRNLVNEYRDGMLLFEISNREVWEKATSDKAGLEAFFKANRRKYTFDKPRYKGYVVFAVNDSVEAAVKSYIAENNVSADSVGTVLRKQFGSDVKVERVISAMGENPIIDDLIFYGDRPAITGKWTNYFAFAGKVIYAPEEASDMRGIVTTDYQNALEKAWVDELRGKYKVKINNKVLETLK